MSTPEIEIDANLKSVRSEVEVAVAVAVDVAVVVEPRS
jgi:hypothetical protein